PARPFRGTLDPVVPLPVEVGPCPTPVAADIAAGGADRNHDLARVVGDPGPVPEHLPAAERPFRTAVAGRGSGGRPVGRVGEVTAHRHHIVWAVHCERVDPGGRPTSDRRVDDGPGLTGVEGVEHPWVVAAGSDPELVAGTGDDARARSGEP